MFEPMLGIVLLVQVIEISFVVLGAGAKSSSLNAIFEYVDVRDVAYAHIQAFEVPSASGRYILVGDVKNIYEALKNVKEQYYPTLSLPEK